MCTRFELFSLTDLQNISILTLKQNINKILINLVRVVL